MVGGKKVNFTAACLNVDGLPPSLSILGIKINMNPDSREGDGARAIGEKIHDKAWDFVGLSEDFNYHDELTAPLQHDYQIGWYRGPVSLGNATLYAGKAKIDSDGLCFFWRKDYKGDFMNEIPWAKTNGYTNQGSDELIKKGFRHYVMYLDQGMEVDVYTLHMDAETNDADNQARLEQMDQLVNYIKGTNNHRPIIVMGDTNCRYNRDGLYEHFIAAINADSRFTAKDVWVEYEWNNNHPCYAAENDAATGYPRFISLGDAEHSITEDKVASGHTSHEINQLKEVVDKIFYINNSDANGLTLTANSFLHDDDFNFPDPCPEHPDWAGQHLTDHYPIVVNFTLEQTQRSFSGKYYLLNRGANRYIKQGGAWGTQLTLGKENLKEPEATRPYYMPGTRLDIARVYTSSNLNAHSIHTTICANESDEGASDEYALIKHCAPDAAKGETEETYFMDGKYDGSDGGILEWSFESVEGDEEEKYETISTVLSGVKRYLTADPTSNLVTLQPYDASNLYQQWEQRSMVQMIDELKEAQATSPRNATFLIPGAEMGRKNISNRDYWRWQNAKDLGTIGSAGSVKGHNYKIGHNMAHPDSTNLVYIVHNGEFKSTVGNSSEWKVNYDSDHDTYGLHTRIPNGHYKIYCQFLRDNVNRNSTLDHADSANGMYFAVNGFDMQTDRWGENGSRRFTKNKILTSDNNSANYAVWCLRDNSTKMLTHWTEHEFDVTDNAIHIEMWSHSHTSPTAVVFDNFRLVYYGLTTEQQANYDRVKAAIDDAQAKADALGLSGYSNRDVVSAWEERYLSGDGQEEINQTYANLAAASKAQKELNADMRYAILNPCFEQAYVLPQEQGNEGSSLYVGDAGARTAPVMTDHNGWTFTAGSDITTAAEASKHQAVYFAGAAGGSASQSVSGLYDGFYQVSALLTPGTTLTANDASVTASGTGSGMVETTVTCRVSNGTLAISVSNPAAFKADCFRLTRTRTALNILANEMVASAIVDATVRVRDEGLNPEGDWDLSAYEDAVRNFSIEGDGSTEFLEIYTMLRNRLFRKNMATETERNTRTDFTSFIINPCFEIGAGTNDLLGYNVTDNAVAGRTWGWNVIPSNDTQVAPNSNGTYHVDNCCEGHLFNTWSTGYPITQSLTGLPAGEYEISCLATSGDGNDHKGIWLMVNGQGVAMVDLACSDSSNPKGTFTEMTGTFKILSPDEAKSLQQVRQRVGVRAAGYDSPVIGPDTPVTIGAVGAKYEGTTPQAIDPEGNGTNWYKVDNFKLALTKRTWDTSTGVDNVTDDVMNSQAPADIYTPAGIEVARNVKPGEILGQLPEGIYIVRQGAAAYKILR